MKNKRIIIDWSLLIAWMVLIFFMSNQPGEVSTKQSDLVIKIFSLIGIDLNSYLGSIATFIIRKAAHFTEYFILYCLSIRLLKQNIEIKKARIYCLLIVLGYAITDEIHQYFVPGRAMALRDVLIDFSGGIFGYLLNCLIYNFKNKKNRIISKEDIVA